MGMVKAVRWWWRGKTTWPEPSASYPPGMFGGYQPIASGVTPVPPREASGLPVLEPARVHVSGKLDWALHPDDLAARLAKLDRTCGDVRRLTISEHCLIGPLGILVPGPKRAHEVLQGVPEDAEIVDAAFDRREGCLRLWIRHPSYKAADGYLDVLIRET